MPGRMALAEERVEYGTGLMGGKLLMKRFRIILFSALVLLTVCFIFSNSVQSRGASIERSSTVMAWIKPLLDPHDRISDSVFHHYLRKAAHFTEFAALGFFLMGLSDSFAWKRKNRGRLLLPLLGALCVAASDETIQLFSSARGPGIRDVLIDFCGASFGILCMLGLLLLIRRFRHDARGTD